MVASRTLPNLTTHPSGISGSDYADALKESIEALWGISFDWLTSVGGTANAITANAQTSLGGYGSGMGPGFILVPASDNTGSVTININGLGTVNLKDMYGDALIGGELEAGRATPIILDSTPEFRMLTAPRDRVALFEYQTTNGTAGGTATGGSRQKYPLNTQVLNNIQGCSLASNVVTLPKGRYRISCGAGFYRTELARIRVYDTTGAVYFANQVTATDYNDAAGTWGCVAQCEAEIVLTASRDIELAYYVNTTRSTDGLGLALSESGQPESYGYMKIIRVGPK